ncbi:MAG: type II toxin-antitoxin system VapC family toxin [Rickettsiales bacterium]
MKKFVIDTDVLIDATRGFVDSLAFFEKYEDEISVSVITFSEIYSGFKNDKEERRVMAFCNLFERIEVNEEIAILAGRFRKKYGKSHGSGIIDCIIAATAHYEDATLVTLNKKHFPMLTNILVPYKKS